MARFEIGCPSTLLLTSSFLAPSLTRAHVADPDELPLGRGLDDDVLEILDLGQPPERAQGDLGLLTENRRRLADLAGRDLEILLAQRHHHVAGGHPAGGKLVGIEPDPHAVVALPEHPDVADARQPGKHGLELDRGVV